MGPSYETFPTAIRVTKPAPMFRDLVTQAESHELFLKSLHGTPTPTAAFHVETTNNNSAQGRGRSFPNRGNHSCGRDVVRIADNLIASYVEQMVIMPPPVRVFIPLLLKPCLLQRNH